MGTMICPRYSSQKNSYRIQRLLGQGGFGAVYLAEDLVLNKQCAIKESFDTSPAPRLSSTSRPASCPTSTTPTCHALPIISSNPQASNTWSWSTLKART